MRARLATDSISAQIKYAGSLAPIRASDPRDPRRSACSRRAAESLDILGTELASTIDGPIFVTSSIHRPALRWDRPTIVVELSPPTSAQRAQLWRTELAAGTEDDADYLATQYPLAPALIHRA